MTTLQDTLDQGVNSRCLEKAGHAARIVVGPGGARDGIKMRPDNKAGKRRGDSRASGSEVKECFTPHLCKGAGFTLKGEGKFGDFKAAALKPLLYITLGFKKGRGARLEISFPDEDAEVAFKDLKIGLEREG